MPASAVEARIVGAGSATTATVGGWHFQHVCASPRTVIVTVFMGGGLMVISRRWPS